MLQVRDVHAGYSGRKVLHGVSLHVDVGEVVALVGPNGAGKTTLLRVISGVLRPQRGQVLWQGKDMLHRPPRARARLVAVVPQSREGPLAFTVEQTVLLGRTPYMGWLGIPGPRDRRALEQALALADLTHLRHRRLFELSGGEQQRVLLARALAQETPLLLLDEPTTHLDLFYQAHFLGRVRRLARETHRAVLIVLHDLNLAALYADRVYLLARGRVFAQGPPTQVFTPARLEAVYGLKVQVLPLDGTVMVIPKTEAAG